MKKHLLQAVERGDAEAQFDFGIIYENGLDDSRYAVEGIGRRRYGGYLPPQNRACPRADQTRRSVCGRTRDTGELG
jgi:hypothetical protein